MLGLNKNINERLKDELSNAHDLWDYIIVIVMRKDLDS